MEKRTIGITSATIRGLNEKVYYLDAKCFWAWDIKFESYPLFTFTNLCFLCMGETEDEARKTRRKIKKIFDNNYIHDGDRVAIIYDNDGVVAIGKNRHDCWIHVRDKYKFKTFKELKLNFDELVVACN